MTGEYRRAVGRMRVFPPGMRVRSAAQPSTTLDLTINHNRRFPDARSLAEVAAKITTLRCCRGQTKAVAGLPVRVQNIEPTNTMMRVGTGACDHSSLKPNHLLVPQCWLIRYIFCNLLRFMLIINSTHRAENREKTK